MDDEKKGMYLKIGILGALVVHYTFGNIKRIMFGSRLRSAVVTTSFIISGAYMLHGDKIDGFYNDAKEYLYASREEKITALEDSLGRVLEDIRIKELKDAIGTDTWSSVYDNVEGSFIEAHNLQHYLATRYELLSGPMPLSLTAYVYANSNKNGRAIQINEDAIDKLVDRYFEERGIDR